MAVFGTQTFGLLGSRTPHPQPPLKALVRPCVLCLLSPESSAPGSPGQCFFSAAMTRSSVDCGECREPNFWWKSPCVFERAMCTMERNETMQRFVWRCSYTHAHVHRLTARPLPHATRIPQVQAGDGRTSAEVKGRCVMVCPVCPNLCGNVPVPVRMVACMCAHVHVRLFMVVDVCVRAHLCGRWC